MGSPSSAAILAPLSRFLQTDDYLQLAPELARVDARWDDSQHPARRWEYALALHAIRRVCPPWREERPVCVDVGGYGSPFFRMLADDTGGYPTLVDPKAGTGDLATYLRKRPRPRLADIVTCISVLEHIPEEQVSHFLYHLSCLLAPGGLLVLTMDAVDHEVEHDTFHFHWMRERIYTPVSITGVVHTLRPLRISPEADLDFGHFSPHVFDYSFFSLVCRKAQ